MDKLTIVKVGGGIIEDPARADTFLKAFADIKGYKILVHGGGKSADLVLDQMGIIPRMHEGRRLTDEASLKVVTMIYAGWINKSLVSRLQALQVNAIGLSGADGNCIEASKRPVKLIDYGFAGDIVKVRPERFTSFLLNGFSPVLCPITHDTQGQLLNTNADTIASAVAVALSADFEVSLRYCFELDGVLTDMNDPKSIISRISDNEYEQLKNAKIISAGMIPKLDNALSCRRQGVAEVIICGVNNLSQPARASQIL